MYAKDSGSWAICNFNTVYLKTYETVWWWINSMFVFILVPYIDLMNILNVGHRFPVVRGAYLQGIVLDWFTTYLWSQDFHRILETLFGCSSLMWCTPRVNTRFGTFLIIHASTGQNYNPVHFISLLCWRLVLAKVYFMSIWKISKLDFLNLNKNKRCYSSLWPNQIYKQDHYHNLYKTVHSGSLISLVKQRSESAR